MKLTSTVYLIWAFINSSAAALLDVVDSGATVAAAAAAAREAISNAAHQECQLFGESVKVNPLNAPSIEKVSFQLRTPCGQKEFSVSTAGELPNAAEYNANWNTEFYVTGWLSNTDVDYVADMTKAHNCRGDNNFVVVNTGGVLTNEYMSSAYHTTILGEFIAIGLMKMGIPTANIHLTGHSLGAHICGSAGRHYYSLTGEKIPRITGLDPARPCFVTTSVFPRIGLGDADHVDIFHSNPKDLGMEEAVGHVDFYPGGLDVFQSSCSPLSVGCSHTVVNQYYIESLYPGNEYGFMAALCDGFSSMVSKACSGPKSPMGYVTDTSLRGIHYLVVRNKTLYGVESTNPATGNCGLCS